MLKQSSKREPKNVFFDEAVDRWKALIRHGDWPSEGLDGLKYIYASWYQVEKPVPVPVTPAPIPFRKKPKKPVRVAASAQLSMFGESEAS